ncbi:MAG: TetR/AcrR family transcriptional regulator [Lachnospiraceae bacterium]|nr:TetR/AcrR family transcriptional regulator [Lachnospiraceae bacterium]
MNGKFFDLSKEKQDRMMNAALKVFSNCGYRHASTDIIVREAGISKGLLFHYFESKIGLYSFIYEYSVRYVILELRSNVNAEETDLFELIKQVEQARMCAMKGYPYMQQFLNRSMYEDVSEALLAIEAMRTVLTDTYDAIFAKAHSTEFPQGFDYEKIRRMLEYTIQGLMNEQFLNGSFQPEILYQEIVEYVNMVRDLTSNAVFTSNIS